MGGGGEGDSSVGPTTYTLFTTLVLRSNEAPAASTYDVAAFILESSTNHGRSGIGPSSAW